jgi:hypothetical protein
MLSSLSTLRRAALAAACLAVTASSAAAEERLMFSATENVRTVLVSKIRAETERLDIGIWYLTERAVTDAIIDRHRNGVTVRVLGDRVSIFENDPNTTREFEHLAMNGVPIRVRYNPTWFPEIIHWKFALFSSRNEVTFGSANFTVFELAPWAPGENYHDESTLFTDDSSLVNAFRTQFDKYWANTTVFKDFNEAYRLERGSEFPVQLQIDRTRLEPDYPTPSDLIWVQGWAFNGRVRDEILRETNAVDICIYRLSEPAITDALINRHQQGVPVRVIIETNEYNRDSYPEYELTRYNIDRLWLAGVPIKRRVHAGLMHMKTLITSSVATNASSNFTRNFERDHNYFIQRSQKSALWTAFKNRFNAMWGDSSAFGSHSPAGPRAASLVSPANGATGVSQTPTLRWKRASWAVAFDVYLGTSTSNMAFVGRVNAVLNENPPSEYSWTSPTTLAGGTTHYWKIVSRTYAGLTASSATRSFVTTGSGGGGGTQSPFGGSPVSLPGTVQAENFDNGGINVAYWDQDGGNKGNVYRSTDVDIQATADTSGGYNVGWIGVGEWLEYTVNVATAGTYTLEARVAHPSGGGTFRVEFGGVNKTGTMTIPGTGSYQSWSTVSQSVSLSAGTQVMRVFFIATGPSGGIGNLNWIRLVSGGGGDPGGSTPFSGSPVALPGTVQAENFDNGGIDVAYWDKDSTNKGGAYRNTAVDIQATSDSGGGFNVSHIAANEWLNYTVNVTTSGTYTLEARVASLNQGGTFHVEFDGVNETSTMTIPATGSYQTWTTISKSVSLSAGTQVMRVVFDAAGPSGGIGNLNWIRLVSGSSASSAFTGTPATLPGLVQAEDFDHGGLDVAYWDKDSTNKGGDYRDTGVDVQVTADAGGGHNVGWIAAGEWLNYSVDVAEPGNYTLSARVASPSGGGTFHVAFDGENESGAMTVPATGSYQTWTTISTPVSLSAGTQVMRVSFDAAGPSGGIGNLNWIDVQ